MLFLGLTWLCELREGDPLPPEAERRGRAREQPTDVGTKQNRSARSKRSAQGGTVLYTGLRRRIDLAQSPASQGGKRGTMPKDLSPTCLYKLAKRLLFSFFIAA